MWIACVLCDHYTLVDDHIFFLLEKVMIKTILLILNFYLLLLI